MGATRLNLEIYSHTMYFRKRFKVFAYTEEYLQFTYNSYYDYACVTIMKTSQKCFRVMSFISHLQVKKLAEYKSFRTIAELCVYLDTLSVSLV